MRTYSMFKKFFNKTIYDSNNTLVRSKLAVFFFKFAFYMMSAFTLFVGLFPQFSSFQRIFYIEDTNMFLWFYMVCLFLLIISSISFLVMALCFKVFLKWYYAPVIVLLYLMITALLSLDAYVFTSFVLTENGYEVPFNLAVYLIDIFVLLPLYVLLDYFVSKNGIRKIKALPPDDIKNTVL